ncbi:MAG: WD40 repeat domain-containing protein [Candidatus Altiarchaeota archaeon]
MKKCDKREWPDSPAAKSALLISAICLLSGVSADNQVYKQAPMWAHHVPGKVSTLNALNDTTLIGGENGLYKVDYAKITAWFVETSGSVTAVKPLDDGRIIGASSDGSMKLVDAAGNVIWDRTVPGYVGYGNALDADDGGIICGSMDGYVYMLDLNGTYRWKHLVGSYVTYTRLLADRAIAVSDRQAYILDRDGKVRLNLNIVGYIRYAEVTEEEIIIGMSDGTLEVYDIDGSRMWGYKTGQNITAVDGDSNITVGTRERHVYHLSKDGTLLWELNMSDAVAAVRGDEGRILIGTQDGKSSLYTDQGGLKWFYETDGRPTALDMRGQHVISGTTTGWTYYSKLPTKDPATSFIVSVAVMAIVGASLLMVSRSWR